MEKTGNTIARELQHTMTFLANLGYDTAHLTTAQVVSIKTDLLKKIAKELGEPTNEVENPF